ncbi:hypothetical protein DL93DRAFT_2172485 [Clavulina sp. PMI_390]|nr:hypothetical protein DL93DRAFT_2172485 [Clavulina sp. PMI_390]
MGAGLQSFCSDVRVLVDQLERLGETALSAATQQAYSPHTRAKRAEAVSSSLGHSEQLLQLLSSLLNKTQSLHDSLRLEHAVAANSVCPVLQIPDELLRMIFHFHAQDHELDDSDPHPAWLMQVCRRWRATALVCPRLWTTINPADPLPILQRSLQLSSDLPLQVLVSRCPPRRIRDYEKEAGSIQDIIRQIEERPIRGVSIVAEALSDGLALCDAFGRDSTLSLLRTEKMSLLGGSPTFFQNQMDLRFVDFPNLEIFELKGCSFPRLSDSQLWCLHLDIHGLDTVPGSLVGFLEGFRHVETLVIRYLSIISSDIDDDDWWPVSIPSLRGIEIINFLAQDTRKVLDLFDTSKLVDLRLEFALAYDVQDESPSALSGHAQILADHFSQPGQYQNVTYLRLSDYHQELSMVLDSVLGSTSTLQFPRLEKLRIIVDDESESTEETREALSTSVKSLLSNRRAQVDRLENLGETGLSSVTEQPFFPHTRAARAEAISGSLVHSEQLLELLDGFVRKAQSFRDSVRLEHSVATNSVCPALQIPDEIQQMIFLFLVAAEEGRQGGHSLMAVCRRWRATASVCPQLWTTIDPADSIPMLQRSLQLSSDLPISISISRDPPPKLRRFEKLAGSVQDVIQQIQQRRISQLTIKGDNLSGSFALCDAFGRGGMLSMLPAEAIHMVGDPTHGPLDMEYVHFPALDVFKLETRHLPILSTSQLWCSRLSIEKLHTTPRNFVKFFEGFHNLRSLNILDVSIAEQALLGPPVLIPGLQSLAIMDSIAQNTTAVLDHLDSTQISDLQLEHVLVRYAEEDSPSGLMGHGWTLAEHFNSLGLYRKVTYLRIADFHDQLPTVVGSLFGSPTSLQFPKLEELRVVVDGGFQPSKESRKALEEAIQNMVSNRRTQGAEPLVLRVPSCLVTPQMTTLSGGSLLEKLLAYSQNAAFYDDKDTESLMGAAIKSLGSYSDGITKKTKSATPSVKATDTEPSHLHWFCAQAPEEVRECATFLIRIHAFRANEAIDKWKTHLAQVMYQCLDCSAGYQDRKEFCKKTYLSRFSDQALKTFFATVDKWEESKALEILADASIPRSSLAYNILCNPALMQNEKLSTVAVQYQFPSPFIPSYTSASIPPPIPLEILHMIVDFRAERRELGTRLRRCFTKLSETSHAGVRLVGDLFRRVQGQSSQSESLPSTILPAPDLWDHLHLILRSFASATYPVHFSTSPTANINLRRVVVNTLMGTTSLPGVLSCFVELLNAQGSSLWAKEHASYPELVFDTLKDHTGMPALLADQSPERQPALWKLQWLQTFMESAWDSPAFAAMLPKMFLWLGEQLQHVTVDPTVHIQALRALFTIMTSLCRKASELKNDAPQACALRETLSTHAEIVARAAFPRSSVHSNSLTPSTNTPSDLRDLALELLRTVFLADASATRRCLDALCPFRDEQYMLYYPSHASAYSRSLSRTAKEELKKSKTPPVPPPALEIHRRLWKATYAAMALRPADTLATELVLMVTATTALIEPLEMESDDPEVSKPWDGASLQKCRTDPKMHEQFTRTVRSVNAALAIMRSGFSTQVEDFAESSSSAVLKLLNREGVVANVLFLLMSPNQDLVDGAKSLVMNAYNVVERSACFFVLLERHARAMAPALIRYLDQFNAYVTMAPAPCDTAKTHVRSMKEILDALGNSSKGLLLRNHYGADDDVDLTTWLPQLWRGMLQAMSSVFQLTKYWANWFSIEDMTQWMRDALIFGRDLISYVHVIQQALDERIKGSASKGKGKRINLILDLPAFFDCTVQWLKLTHPEMLHQAFELTKVLLSLFDTAGVEPTPATLDTLVGWIEDVDNKRTELSRDKRAELFGAIRPWRDDAALPAAVTGGYTTTDDDDDVQIIEPPSKSRKDKEKKNALIAITGSSSSKAGSAALAAQKALWQKNVQAKTVVKGLKTTTGSTTYSSSSKLANVTKTMPPKPKPKPAAAIPAEALRNYNKMQETKAASNILSGPTKPVMQPRTVSGSTRAPITSDSDADDDDEDDDDDEEGLRALREISPKKPKPVERRTVKILDLSETTTRRPQFDQRELVRRQGLRLKPDLSSFHRHIIQWDYDHEGPDPPDFNLRPISVPDSFPRGDIAIAEYHKIFQPLILMETWSGLVASKYENPRIVDAEIVARRHVDVFVDFDIAIDDPASAMNPKWWLSETDIVLLRPIEGTGNVLAKVSTAKKSNEGWNATLRCCLDTDRLRLMSGALALQSHWQLSKVYSLSTVNREYGALMGLQYYDLFGPVMHPQKRALIKSSQRDIRETMAAYKINEPQAQAILGSLATDGFSLIQGPPGTGKTSTITALVGMFLAKRPAPATKIKTANADATKEPPKKILICAPSNAAIDEVTYRLKQGVRQPDGTLFTPKIVRVGHSEKLSPLIQDLSLEAQISQMMNNSSDSKNSGHDLTALRSQLHGLTEKINALVTAKDADGLDAGAASRLGDEIGLARRQRKELGRKLDACKDENESIRRNQASAVRKFESLVLFEADIICSTLSGSGHASLAQFTFETVVIDEAAQSVELNPQQLAPTVLSSRATRFGYNQSLFVRLHKQYAAYLLSIQYRMHPSISRLPSRVFYNSQLMDGDNMAAQRVRPWHTSPLFKPYQFFDVADGSEEKAFGGHSLRNVAEAKLAVRIYETLLDQYKDDYDFDNKIGVIAMYDAQKTELLNQFEKRFGRNIRQTLAFGTVDGFQGQEKEIIIISAVRGGPNVTRIGHVSDVRRMNVAITRARSTLFVLGHAATLERSDEKWRDIVSDARERGALSKVELSKTGGRLLVASIQAPSPSTIPSVSLDPKPNLTLSDAPSKMDIDSISSPVSDLDDSALPQQQTQLAQSTSKPEPSSNGAQPRSTSSSTTTIVPAPPRPPKKKKKKDPEAGLFLPPPKPQKRPADGLDISSSNKRPRPL